GALAIVLDFSGSMAEIAPNLKQWKNPKSKVMQELDVLNDVLRTLPFEMPLSIRVFGHLEPPGPPRGIGPDEAEAIQTRNTRSERIFRGKVTWSPENSAPLQNLITQLREIEPKWGTPLIRSMKDAAEKDFPDQFNGPKTLLVLTDGMDTSYEPGKRVKGV